MGRRQSNGPFERKEVMDLMQQRLDGSIKSLRVLKDRIAEETGEQIALTTLWQQIQKLRGQQGDNKPGSIRASQPRGSKIDGSKISVKQEEDTDGEEAQREPTVSELSEGAGSGSTLRRSTRAAKRKCFSPTLIKSEPKKPCISITPERSNNIAMLPYSMGLRMPGKKRIIRRSKINEPKIWDKKAEEIIRQEALKHEEESADDPLAKAKSKVWLFCEKIDDGGESKAKCRICGMIMVRKLGSTRAMLRHLRKMHSNMIEGIIRPVTKRITAIAGKPRGDDGFDVDDDSAWVEEVDEEDIDDYDEQEYPAAEQCMDKGKVMGYENYEGEGPSYADEVFIREDGTYADGDEFIDVVYVPDGNSYEEMIPKGNDENSYVNNEVHSLDSGIERAATPSRLKRSISDSELAQPPTKNSNHDLEHYDGTNLTTTDSRSLENLTLLAEREKRRLGNQDDVDERFGHIVAASVRTFPPEQREHVRCTIMQCIEDLRNGGETTEETVVSEVTDEEMVQISDV